MIEYFFLLRQKYRCEAAYGLQYIEKEQKMKIKKFSPSGKKPEDDNGKKSRLSSAGGAEKVNRTVYLTVATLLIILAVAVALTSAANRARRGEATDTGEASTAEAPATNPPQTRDPGSETTKPEGTAASVTEPDTPVADIVPTFVLPVNGKLGAEHDPTTQVFSDTMKDWRVHLGIDIQSQVGEPVYAAADGIVTKIWDDPLYGKSMTVGHTGKAVSVYKNLADTLGEGIEVGKEVKAGQIIGAVGDGAIIELADEPHLHFEIKIDDISVNPLDYLSKSALKTLENDTSFEH